MNTDTPIYVGKDAVSQLIRYCQSRRVNRFLVVSDQNTHAALGQRAEVNLRKHGWDVRTVVLNGSEIAADEQRILEVLLHARGEERMYIAVGAGTVTDITRFASHCARGSFIALPTAPSVDAYTSGGAALVMRGFKLTIPAHAPVAIFADLQTLREAPRDLIAAGFGDMVGKYTSLADWQLGTLLLDEPYSAGIAQRLRRALSDCVAHAEEIGKISATGITRLMGALLESGLCMLKFGSSRPASGAEHLLSHFWELKLSPEPYAAPSHPRFHGTRVGVGTVLIAQRYEAIRNLRPQEVAVRLASASPPDRKGEIEAIRAAYGTIADHIIAEHQPLLEAMETNFNTLKQRIRDHWEEIQEIAASVPPAREIALLLEQAGAPNTPQAIGLNDTQVQQALKYSGYLRNRFTVNTLARVLGL